MATESPIHLVDLIVAVFGVLALIITLVFAVIGFRAADRFTLNDKKIRQIEAFLKKEKEHLFGVNNLTQVCFESFANLIVLVDIQRRALEDLLEGGPTGGAGSGSKKFRDGVSRPLDKVLRLSRYLQVMGGSTDQEAREFAQALVEHYPDFATVDFLQALAQARAGIVGEALMTRANELERSLRNVG